MEDNTDDEALTLRALEANHVVVARDGEEAIGYLLGTEARAGRDVRVLPQVTPLNPSLPRMMAFDVLRRIRADAHLKQLPVSVLTPRKRTKTSSPAIRLVPTRTCRKPVNFERFTAAVKVVGVFWPLLNEVSPNPSK